MNHFRIEGQTLTYEIVGDGEPLLIVNPVVVPSSTMRQVASFFNNAGYQVILYDHLGPDDWTVEEIATRTGQLLDHLDVKALVIGFSQGACIAQELALQRPDRVSVAVLVATVGRRSAMLDLFQEAYETLLDLGSPEAPMAALQLLFMFPPALLSDDAQVEAVRASMKAMLGNFGKEDLARNFAIEKRYDQRVPALESVRVPSLVIAFELDLASSVRLGREVADAIPDCQYIEIPGAAHMGMMTHGQQVLAAATEFLDKNRT